MQATYLIIVPGFLTATIYLLVAGLAFVRDDVRIRTDRRLVLFLTVMVIWQQLQIIQTVFPPPPPLNALLEKLIWLGLPLMAIQFFFLTHLFLRLPDWSRKRLIGAHVWWLLLLVFNFTLTLTAVPSATILGSLNSGLLLVTWLIPMAVTAVTTLNAYRKAKRRPLHQNRILYWMLAMSIAVSRDILFVNGDTPLGGVVHLLFVTLIAYVLLTHQLLDVRRIVRRLLAYLILVAMFEGIFLIGLQPVRPYLSQLPGYNSGYNGILLALILILLFDPLQSLARLLTEKSGGTREIRSENTLREYNRAISNIVDLADLEGAIMRLFSRVMDVSYGTLYLVDETANEINQPVYQLSSVQGTENDRYILGAFEPGSPVAHFLMRERKPLTQYDIDLLPKFSELTESERGWLGGAGIGVYVPIHVRDKWIGLLGLGPKLSGERYFDHDLILLDALADQTAIALENARLVTDLVRLNRELKQATVRFEQANQQLQESSHLKSAFIGIITHELRTPFANIDFSFQLLERYGYENLTFEQREQIDHLTTSIDAAKSRVDNLVKFASFFSKQGELCLTEFDFNTLVDETLDSLRPLMDNKQLSLTLDQKSLRQIVSCDRDLVGEAIHHLLHNAIKFTEPEGQIWVRIWLKGSHIYFEVQDNGIGIAENKLDLIWQGFTQISDPLERGLEGLGLGLPLVKYIAEAHGGAVYAESKELVGSIFGFSLRVASNSPTNSQ